jgi:competence protein ComEC
MKRPLIPLFLLYISAILGLKLYRLPDPSGKLLEYAMLKRQVTIEGIVLKPPYLIKNTERFICRSLGENILVTIYGCKKGIYFRPGDKIKLSCKIKKIENLKNPASFNYKRYMKQMGISYKALVSGPKNVYCLGKASLPLPYSLEEKLKSPVRDFFRKNLNKTDFSLYSAIILGEKSRLDPKIEEMINNIGLGHILAVSGLHVGLVAWISFVLIRWLILRSYRLTLMFDSRKLAAATTVIPVLSYCLISGLRIPTQRAMIMVLVFLLSILLDRQEDVISSLCFAGIIVLLVHPESVLSASFQLSFISVAGIVWLTPHVKNYLKSIEIKKFPYLFELICVSVSAVVILFPLILYYFYRFPLFSIPVNIMIIPLLGLWILPAGLISTGMLIFSSSIASIFLKIGAIGIHLIFFIVRLWASIPFSSIWLFKPNLLEILVYYLLLFLFFEVKSKKLKIFGLLFICTMFLMDLGYWLYKNKLNKELRLVLLDAGRSYVSLIELPYGRNILIASGYLNPYLEKMVIIPFLCYSRIKKIDYIVTSNPGKIKLIEKIFCAKGIKRVKQSINGVLIRADKKRIFTLYNGIPIFVERLGSNKGVLIKIKNKHFVYNPSEKGALCIEVKDSIKINRLWRKTDD